MLTINCFAQKVIVQDKTTGQPISYAAISSETPKAYVLTDTKGVADLTNFKGAKKITVNVLGYKSVVTSWNQLQDAAFKLLLKPSNFSLDEVVVTANKWAQSQRNVVQKITSINSSEITHSSSQTAADLLTTTGQVFVQKSQQGGGSPMLRGFATNRVLLSVDGIRMNNAIFRSGNLQNVISIDPFSVRHVEVLFGPGSVIYGSDAIGGIMNFTTLEPKFSTTNNVFVSGNATTRFSSANDELTGHFDINVGGKKWASVTSISHNKFGDLRMGSHGPDEYLDNTNVITIDTVDHAVANKDSQKQVPTAYSMTSMMQKIRFKPSEHWDFTYNFMYSETSNYDRYDRLIMYEKNNAPSNAEWYYGPQKWMINHLKITHKTNTLLFDEMAIHAAQQQFEESRNSRKFGNNNLKIQTEKVDAYSLNFDFIKATGTKSKLLYGVDFVLNNVASKGEKLNIKNNKRIPDAARYPQADWLSAALFATYQYDLSEKINLQAGARYNYFGLKADFDTSYYHISYTEASLEKGALTGSLGMIYRPDETWIIRTGASTGFRTPNVDDMGKLFDSEPGAVIVPNPDLKPEYAYNFEFSMAKVFAETIKVDFTGFYTLLHDAMVRRDFQLNGQDSILYEGTLSRVSAIQNAASATVYGIQTSIEVKLKSGFSLFSTLTWQHGEEELDDGSTSPLRHAAPMFGTTRLRFVTHKLQMDFYANYSAKVSATDMPQEERAKPYMYATDSNGRPYSPAWYTLNFRTMYTINESLSLVGGIENLTDQRYRPYSSGMVAAGRNFFLSAVLHF